MTQSHKYKYKITPNSAPERVVRMVQENKRVLELGSGPGTITKEMTGNGCRVTALEIDPSAIEIVRDHCEHVYPCDFNRPDWPSSLPDIGQFDVLVAADVFEHLYDPWSCLQQLNQFLSPKGSLVVSLPHVGHAAIMACLFNSNFDYQSWGLMDKTHIRFFGLKNIQSLFEDAGFKIIEVDFVVASAEDTELAQHWSQLSEDIKFAFMSGKFSNVYQVVVRAVPLSTEGQALNLVSMLVPPANRVSILKRCKNYLKYSSVLSRLSPETWEKIRRVAGKSD